MKLYELPLLLDATGQAGLYVHPLKILIVVLLLVGWAAGVQWIDRDTDRVHTKREQWNLIVISGALAGYFVLFAVPLWNGSLYVVGLLFWGVLAGGPMVAYLVHRNGRVVPNARVLTPTHIKRLLSGGDDKKKATEDKGQRIRLNDHQGKPVTLPDDLEETKAYNAVQEFLYDMLWRRVSDAELIPGKEKCRVLYKIDGLANERPDGLAPDDGERILRCLKRVAGLNVEEIRRPQIGAVEAALLNHEGSIMKTEVMTSGSTAGERLRLRIPTAHQLLRIHELGLATARLEALKKDVLNKPRGLFLLSATPHNGMTTTQYSILRSHDAYMHRIHTLERNRLLELDNVTQNIFEGPNTDVNFARMLQSVLRREPDIVLVGECEDRETAMIATRAAVEPRKVYMGIHARDSFDALSRFSTLLTDNAAAAKVLVGVMNQRLVRILCTECREAYKPDEATLKKLNLPANKIERFHRPPSEPKLDRKGREIVCPNCQGTGYYGRIGVFELMTIDDTIRQLIAEGAPMNRIKTQCRKNRMYYLQEEGLLKVIDGVTSINEVLRCLRTNEA